MMLSKKVSSKISGGPNSYNTRRTASSEKHKIYRGWNISYLEYNATGISDVGFELIRYQVSPIDNGETMKKMILECDESELSKKWGHNDSITILHVALVMNKPIMDDIIRILLLRAPTTDFYDNGAGLLKGWCLGKTSLERLEHVKEHIHVERMKKRDVDGLLGAIGKKDFTDGIKLLIKWGMVIDYSKEEWNAILYKCIDMENCELFRILLCYYDKTIHSYKFSRSGFTFGNKYDVRVKQDLLEYALVIYEKRSIVMELIRIGWPKTYAVKEKLNVYRVFNMIDDNKKRICSEIPLLKNKIKLKKDGMGARILEMNFRCKIGTPKEVYDALDIDMITYLGIIDMHDMIKKIRDYMSEL